MKNEQVCRDKTLTIQLWKLHNSCKVSLRSYLLICKTCMVLSDTWYWLLICKTISVFQLALHELCSLQSCIVSVLSLQTAHSSFQGIFHEQWYPQASPCSFQTPFLQWYIFKLLLPIIITCSDVCSLYTILKLNVVVFLC